MISWWVSDGDRARVARQVLRPAAWAYGRAVGVHRRLSAARWGAGTALPLPSVGIGSLLVGGAGKTPLASWVAGRIARLGGQPAVLLRGYGGDEGPLHAMLVPQAIVLEDPDRMRAARAAAARGATAVVLDDNAQHRRVRVDTQFLLFPAERMTGPRALLPAGPWRERWTAGRADVIVLTIKTAEPGTVDAALAALAGAYPRTPIAAARLGVTGWRTLHEGRPEAPPAGRALYVACGIADPAPFLAHARTVGHVCGAWLRRDHAPYGNRTVARLVRAAETAGADYVVTTAKDAVKLHARWPRAAPPVLVAEMSVSWERGAETIARLLARQVAGRAEYARKPRQQAAPGPAAGTP